MALGVLSVLLPLYVLKLNGSLIDVGMVVAVAGFSSIPASILWGYISDKTRRCRIFIAQSLIFLALAFFFVARAESLYELLALSVMLGIFRSAPPSVAGILIAESGPAEEWDRDATMYRFTLRIGEVAGLVVATFLVVNFGYKGLLNLGSVLLLASFALSIILVQDPPFMVERKFFRLERAVGFVQRASFVVCCGDRLTPSIIKKFISRGASPLLFGFGVLTFSFATQIVFTPLPVFFSQNVGMPATIVFLVFLVNSLGALFGYLFAEGWIENRGDESAVQVSSFFRALLFPSLMLGIYLPYAASLVASAMVLALIGAFWAVFTVSSSVLCMKIIPEGKMGFYTALIELGSATGMIMGGIISMVHGFQMLFLISGVIFAAAFVLFRFHQ